MKYLYLISRTGDVDDDEYDSAVVCARTEIEAKNTDLWCGFSMTDYNENIDVKLLGLADDNIEIGEICASFNAR